MNIRSVVSKQFPTMLKEIHLYARVPIGLTTYKYYIMLASRGTTYISSYAAGKAMSFMLIVIVLLYKAKRIPKLKAMTLEHFTTNDKSLSVEKLL